MIVFGAFQLLLSQIPDFDRLWFLSVLAAVMSFGYASIGFGLAVGKATGEAHALHDSSCVLCCAVVCCAVLCCGMKCHVVLRCAVLCCSKTSTRHKCHTKQYVYTKLAIMLQRTGQGMGMAVCKGIVSLFRLTRCGMC